MRKVILAASILLLAASCNNNSGNNNGNQAQGSQNSTAQASACTATDLSGISSAQGASGAINGWIDLKNVSNDQCMLSNGAQPVISLYSGTNAITTQAQADKANANSSDLTLAPGQTARVHYVWSNYCGSKLGSALSVTLSLPLGSGVMTIPLSNASGSPLTTAPRCSTRKSGSSLSVGNFVPAGNSADSNNSGS